MDRPQQNVVEKVGDAFDARLLEEASNKTLRVIEASAALISPGMSEDGAKRIVEEQLSAVGGGSFWHPSLVRFGENTLKTYNERGAPGVVLKENDVFFFDLGPIFSGHEGDVGRTFAVGSDPDHQRAATDVGRIWREVRDHWVSTRETGNALYRFAVAAAEEKGWILVIKHAEGHRISDFPHAAHHRGTMESFEFTPSTHRWILEIQIRHPSRPFGAFYEDLLA